MYKIGDYLGSVQGVPFKIPCLPYRLTMLRNDDSYTNYRANLQKYVIILLTFCGCQASAGGAGGLVPQFGKLTTRKEYQHE